MITSNAEATTVLQANQFPVKAVKLFQSVCGAEITRSFPLPSLQSLDHDGPQVIEIVHLPASIQSVDVSVTSTSGNVSILDHYYTQASTGKLQNSTPSSETLRELEEQRLRLEDERRLRQQSFTFLTTYMDSLAQCKGHGQPEAAQMVTFFDEFVEIGVTRSAAIAEIDAKLADVRNRIAKETQRLSKLSTDLPIKVVTVLSCNSQVPPEVAELTVTYVVKQVSWKPAYDLHIAMTGNTPSPTTTLEFRCTVTQWTGENWENVSLALTTAEQVSQLIQLPEPKQIDIGLGSMSVFPTTNLPRYSVFGQPGGFEPSAQLRQTASNEGLERDREREAQALPRQHLFGQSTKIIPTSVVNQTPKEDAPSQTHSQLVSYGSKEPITHIASGSIFIPSDHTEHHVLVSSLTLQAEFMRVVVPSMDTRVYYTCKVENSSEYVLLPGDVKAYLNGKHVSSTEIHNTDLPQILECSLAVDAGMKAMVNRATNALPSVAAFTGKATTTYTSTMVLHNTHAEPIRSVIVRSSIPLPTDPRITITLKQPAGLAEIDEGSVSVKEGCLARWSTTSGRKGKQAGLFEWVCDLNPGTEVLEAVWEVCAPQDLKLLEQVRTY